MKTILLLLTLSVVVAPGADPAWPNPHDELPEYRAACLDERDWGIRVYRPGLDCMTFYRHPSRSSPSPPASSTITAST